MRKLEELLEAAQSAAEWLIESYDDSDPRERGERLMKAVKKFTA